VVQCGDHAQLPKGGADAVLERDPIFMLQYTDLDLHERILLGPGPSMVPPRVLRAIAHPPVGHLDPDFIALMNEVQDLLRYLFQTENRLTIPVSGTGSAGMEAALCNFIEPGDPVLVGVNGYFSERIYEIATRYGADVQRLENPWGQVFALKDIEHALQARPAKLVALTHVETSTGTCQPVEGLADIVHHYGGILVLDCVASLGGVPVRVDDWGIDVAHSATQKCLSCPPGLAPITVSRRALDILCHRKTKVANWYLDLSSIEKYWGNERTYHHTAPVSMNYALREALRLIYEEGIEVRTARHRANAELLWQGLEEIGLEPVVPLEHRPPSLTTVWVPEGVDDLEIRQRLLQEYNISIAGGLGDFKGRVWRIGLMGHSARAENVVLLLAALDRLLSG
jgi:alanine-glyoxylate transaminase/serine-glyoxylate transaminase/serine-pyruvate transaminase